MSSSRATERRRMVLRQREGNQEAETGGANVCTDYHQQVHELINHVAISWASGSSRETTTASFCLRHLTTTPLFVQKNALLRSSCEPIVRWPKSRNATTIGKTESRYALYISHSQAT